jgi:O-antigen/teichoic acid export membrane protein
MAAVTFIFSSSIATTIFPQISEWEADDSVKKIEKLVSRAISPSLLFMLPSFFGVLLFSKEILRYVFGPEYTIAWLVLVVLMGDKVFQGFYSIIGKALQAIDRPNLSAKATIVSMIINICLNIILVLQFGLVGAAFATGIAALLNGLLKFHYLSDYMTVSIPWSEIRWGFASSAIMAIILVLASSIIYINSVIKLFIMVLLGAVIYFISLFSRKNIREKVAAGIKNK